MLTHRRTDECDPACDVVGQSRSPRHGSADSCSQDRGENGHISVPPRQAFCGSSAAEADFLNQSHTRPSCGTSFPRSSPPPPASPPEWEPRIPAHPAMCGRKNRLSGLEHGQWLERASRTSIRWRLADNPELRSFPDSILSPLLRMGHNDTDDISHWSDIRCLTGMCMKCKSMSRGRIA